MTEKEFLERAEIPPGCLSHWVFRRDGSAHYIVASVERGTQDAALEICRNILAVAQNHRAYVRVPPQATSYYDAAHRKQRHWGYVRFQFWEEPGEWLVPVEPEILAGISPRTVETRQYHP